MSTASGELTNRTKHLDLGLESFTLMFCSSFQLHFFVACNFAFWSKVERSAKYSVRFQLPVGGRGLARPRSAADAAVMAPQQRRTLRVIPPHVCGALHDWCSTCTQASTGHCGIDAQLAQACAEPHIYLSSISASSTVRAARCGADRHGRLTARCHGYSASAARCSRRSRRV